ncbi:putative amidohydrolase [Mycolicibacterium mucogenicum 261Sha1.1M5]|nr:putative amidohydrolase [Mycolicibacterium mucogenicum 261Sha1.1M5]
MALVACSQFTPVLGAVRENVDRSLELIREAAGRGAQVVVLPELASSGYAFADTAEAAAASEPATGESVTRWHNAAAELGIVIVAGFAETNPDGAPYNSAALVMPGADPVIYRKAHLWDRERLIFTPGDDLPPVVDTFVGRIGVMVCYDLEFPEWVRIAALAGAELICAPVNWPTVQRPTGERPGEVVRVQAEASMNRVAIAACDRGGNERGVEWSGASVIVDADGWPLALTERAGDRRRPAPQPTTAADGSTLPDRIDPATTIFAEIDLAASRTKRIAAYSDVIADRRTDLYERYSR